MTNKIALPTRALGAGLALMAAAVPQLRASEFDEKTVMTFSAPVRIAGKTLPAGTYVFKTPLSNSRNVVIVMNKEENQVLTAVNTIPLERSVVPEKVRVQLYEGPPSSPEVIHAWFYPGDNSGWEFLRPKVDAALSAEIFGAD